MERKDILKVIADNPALTQAVRETIEKYFSTDGLDKDQADVVLGQMVRARLVGLKAVDDAFKEIMQYQSVSDRPKRAPPPH